MGNGKGLGFDERLERGDRGAEVGSVAAQNDPARLIQRRMRREIQRRGGPKAIPSGQVVEINETGGKGAVIDQLDLLAFMISSCGANQRPDFTEVGIRVANAIATKCADPLVRIDQEEGGRHWTGQILFGMTNPQKVARAIGGGKSTSTVGSGTKDTAGHESGSETGVSADVGVGKEGGP